MRSTDSGRNNFELNALRELSARLGSNPLLSQASSGNISYKSDDSLWIKASGKWMIHAEDEDFLVSVELARAKRCLREDTAIPETEDRGSRLFRASIETAMHVVLPQRVVIHVHSVNAISWAVREDGPSQLNTRLAGLHWQWIPYTPSGVFLARKIEDALIRCPHTNVFVLGNHGLVVCENSCRSAEQLLTEVEQCLAIEPRSAPRPNLRLLSQALPGSAWSLPACSGVHSLATDTVSKRIVCGGVLYPCQAIFLLGSARAVDSFHIADEPECNRPEYIARQVFVMVEDYGVLASEHMTRAEQETLIGLANIVQRIDASAPLRYLATFELGDVLNGAGESYRRLADGNRGRHLSSA